MGNCICEKVSEKVWDQFVADRMQVVALSQKWKKKKQQHNCPSIQRRKGASCFWRKRDLPKEILPCIFHLMREVGQRGKFWSRVVSQKMFKHWRKKKTQQKYLHVRTYRKLIKTDIKSNRNTIYKVEKTRKYSTWFLGTWKH